METPPRMRCRRGDGKDGGRAVAMATPLNSTALAGAALRLALSLASQNGFLQAASQLPALL